MPRNHREIRLVVGLRLAFALAAPTWLLCSLMAYGLDAVHLSRSALAAGVVCVLVVAYWPRA